MGMICSKVYGEKEKLRRLWRRGERSQAIGLQKVKKRNSHSP